LDLEGTLTISGSGAMEDYENTNSAPWSGKYDIIKSVIVENGVTHIGEYAFYGLSTLEEVCLASGVKTIGDYAFQNCEKLEEIILSNSVDAIGAFAFSACRIGTMILPDSVATMGDGVFAGCKNLEEVVLSKKITSLRGTAFIACTSLRKVVFPEGISEISPVAFLECSSDLELWGYPGTVVNSYAKEHQFGYVCIEKATPEYTVPEDLTALYESYLGDVVIPEVENGYFSWQDSSQWLDAVGEGYYYAYFTPYNTDDYLTVYDIPVKVTVLPLIDYGQCGEGVTWELDLEGTLTISGSGAMENYESGEIPWYEYKESIKKVIVGQDITHIADYAFYDCQELNEVELSESIVEIGRYAFTNCVSLEQIKIPSGVSVINEYTFHNCVSLKRVELNGTLTRIGTFGFESCSSLREMSISAESLVIEFSAFSHCVALEKVVFSGTVKELWNYVFYDCPKLKDIDIPEDIQSIGWFVFYGCKSLTSINWPASISVIPDGTFWGCCSLESVEFSGEIVEIGNHAFAECTNLSVVELPEGLKSLGEKVFEKCGFHDIQLPPGLLSIGEGTFSSTNLTWIQIPNSVEVIGDYAFGYYDGSCDTPNTSFIIYGDAGTAAEMYAIENQMKFVDLGGKQKPDFSAPVGITATFEDTLSLVSLPELENGWFSWENGDESVGTVGEKTFLVTFTPQDTQTYAVIPNIEVVVTVVPKQINEIELPQIYERVYDPKTTLGDIALPEGWEWNDESVVPTVGNEGYLATYTPADVENYDYSEANLTPILVVTVKKAVPQYETPIGLTAVYGDALALVELPETPNGVFTWENGNQTVGEVGRNSFMVAFTPNDTRNYKTIGGIEVVVEVSPKKAAPIQIPNIADRVYDPELSLGEIVLPEGWSWDDETIVPTAGNSGYKATYTPVDTKNYDYSGQDLNPTLTIKVERAVPAYEVSAGLTAVYGDILMLVELPETTNGMFTWDNGNQTVGEVGRNNFLVTFTPDDTENYKTIRGIEVVVEVSPKKAEQIAVPKVADRVYDPEITLGDIELPEGWSWDDETIVLTAGNSGYKATYTPADSKNYDYSGQDLNPTLTIKVEKAVPVYEVSAGLTAVYGDILMLVELPETPNGVFTWENGNQTVGEVGRNNFMVTFTPNDTRNYKTIGGIEVVVEVSAKKAAPIQIPNIADRVYDPEITLGDIELPEGWSWDDETIVPTAGNSGYKATYTPADSKNYDYSGQDLNPTLTVKVERAVPVYEVPVGLTAETGNKLADVELPKGFCWEDGTQSVGEAGNRVFLAVYTPEDEVNYSCVEHIEVMVRVVESDPVKAFARRFYTCLLDREAEEEGLDWWTAQLKEGTYTAAQAAASFIFGPEFVGQNNSNEVFLDRLYATFFDREADEGGKTYWLSYLDNGVTREYVTAQFVNSAEFESVCAEYGMQRGSIGLSGYVNQNPNLTMYVVRCYREIHGREADPSGLEYWCEMSATKQSDAAQVARSFVGSQEFVERNLSNKDYMEVLYRAFMGRSSDPGGLAYWLGRLESGTSRLTALDEFANCPEFWNILASFGL